jgi:hypothetical protein
MKRSLITSLVVLLIAGAAAAADVEDYHRRVSEAAEQVRLLVIAEDGAEDTEEGVRQVRKLLPKSENVEMESQVVTIDNTWLHEMLASYEIEANQRKRMEQLTEIGSRLGALETKLGSLNENGREAEAENPKDRIREVLSRPAYREKTDSPITAFIKETRRKIISFIEDVLRKIFGGVLGQGSGASALYLILIVIALGAALILAVRMLRGRGSVKRRDQRRTVLGEEIEAGVTSADLAAAALAAARAGDFRTAMRKLYISLLYEMAERDLIEIEAHVTNREYLARVSRFAALASSMRYLTDRFDYFWYGMFPSSEADFKEYMEHYSEAMEGARSAGQQAAKV